MSALAFSVCLGVQVGLYLRRLVPALGSGDAGHLRRGLWRWLVPVAAWQALVLLAVVAYALASEATHPPGAAWLAPPLAAIAGTALPLQLAAFRILRALRG